MNRARFIVTYSLENFSIGRFHNAPKKPNSQHGYAKHEIVHDGVIAEAEKAKKIASGDRLDAIFSMCPANLRKEEENNLSKR